MDRATEMKVRELVRREMDARTRSPIFNSTVSPRGLTQGRVSKRLVTSLPRVAQEFDEVHLESSGGSIQTFLYHDGAWRPVGSFVKVTCAIAAGGGLPLDGEFTKEFDDTIIEVFMAGSGFRSSSGLIGMNLLIDGVALANITSMTNETFSHKAFVSRIYTHPNDFLGTGAIAAGLHDVDLTAYDGNTQTDSNDTFYVTITERFAETN